MLPIALYPEIIAKCYSSHFDTAVLVEVGPKKQKFTIHKGLLCAYSSYFKAALQGGFKEADEQTITLPEDDAKVFEHFQLWIYTGAFMEAQETKKEEKWDIIISLYLFAEARGIPELQNLAIDTYMYNVAALKQVPTRKFRQIYDNTMASSPLRRLTTRLTVQFVEPSWFLDASEKYWSREILLEVVKGLVEEKGKMGREEALAQFISHRCDYHVHAEGESRCNENVMSKITCTLRLER